MLFDSHIHVGQFYDIYTSPEDIFSFIEKVGIDGCAVSSTTVCEENHEKVISEMEQLVGLNNKCLPVLWVTPLILSDDAVLQSYLDSKIGWCCVKVHPQLSPKDWCPDGENFRKAIELADKINLPILIHTGEQEGCYPLLLSKMIGLHPDTKFILAHGRPSSEALEVLRLRPNTYVDTAFMPVDNIIKFVNAGFEDRVLWGTDYPIQKYFYQEANHVAGYRNKLQELKDAISIDSFKKISYLNYLKLFDKNHES